MKKIYFRGSRQCKDQLIDLNVFNYGLNLIRSQFDLRKYEIITNA